jgi:hypothetical protein
MMLKERRFLPEHELDIESRETIINKITEIILLQNDILFAYAYGSFIRNEPFRDIDIAVYTKGDKGFIFESSLSVELSDVVKFEVEVKILNTAPVAFQMSVIREGRMLFSKDEKLRTNFIEEIGRRYIEYSHFRNIFMGIDGKSGYVTFKY